MQSDEQHWKKGACLHRPHLGQTTGTVHYRPGRADGHKSLTLLVILTCTIYSKCALAISRAQVEMRIEWPSRGIRGTASASSKRRVVDALETRSSAHEGLDQVGAFRKASPTAAVTRFSPIRTATTFSTSCSVKMKTKHVRASLAVAARKAKRAMKQVVIQSLNSREKRYTREHQAGCSSRTCRRHLAKEPTCRKLCSEGAST